MVVQCTPVRLLFSNINNGYKVWSCQASNAPDDFEFQQNSKKFTVAGDNLDFLEFGQKCTIDVELNKNVKYKASYELVGIPGIDCTMEGIEVDPAQELEILNGITTRALAKNTHEAYPNFVQLILSGREKEIDTNKIKGVGPKYFEVFQTKIKKSCRSIMFGAIGKKYGLSAIDCKALVTKYKSPIELEQAINSEPYRVFIDECGKSFKASDKTILSHFPDLIKSSQRCLYACVAMLKYNESEGSTKIAAKDLFAAVSTAYPMLADKIFEQVTTSDKIHYDEATKYCAMKSTYLAECNIAKHINYRLAHPDEIHCEDVERFAEIDGNRLTDEQCEIMRLIQHNNVMMLTGNAGCVDCDTEFFTGTGWKRIADYKHGDKVLQYNMDGTANLVKPLAYIKKPCDSLWHFETPHSINQTICEEHRILYKNNWTQNIRETNILSLKEKSDNNINWAGKFITQFFHYGNGMNMSDENIRIMVAVMADGHFDTRREGCESKWCTIRLKKERKIVRIEKLLNEAKIHYKKNVDKFGITIFRFYAPERRKIYGGDWWNLNKHQAEIICNELPLWDGTIIKSRVHQKEKPCFRTTEKESADYAQYIFTINGWQSTISTDENCQSRESYGKTTYIVTTKHNKLTSLCFDNRPTKKKTEFVKVQTIDGYKYCFQVPSTMLVLRRKNCIFITGNCGKTSSMRAFVSMLDNCGITHTILAPTGTAAKQITKATGREASTIHMFLATDGIAGNVIILEEFSMVSTELFSTLLTAIGLDKKLVLICDPAQLPSISCGNLATDLINSGKIPIANLTRIFRYNSSGLITVATDVRNGSNESLTKKFPDYELIEPNNDIQGEDIMSCVLRTYHRLVSEYGKHDVLVLSPYNVGSAGTFEINQRIQALEQKNTATNLRREVTVGREKKEICFRCNDMVINKKNNYHMLDVDTEEEVFIANGAIGEIIKVGDNCMTVNYDGRHIFVEEDQIRHTMLGYAISIHSSQGSQAKAVIVVMDSSHARMLNRNLEYVAMTRSIEKLVVIGDIRAVEYGLNIEATNNRKTFLKEMLK